MATYQQQFRKPPVQTSIPVPTEALPSLRATAMATKEAVEVLQGQRGTTNTAVTWEDLLNLGLIQSDQLPPHVR